MTARPGEPGPGQPGPGQPEPGQPEPGQPGLAGERASLVAFGRRMVAEHLVDGMSGNLSVRTGELVAITPSGVAYDEIQPAGICLVALADGRQVGGGRPSTETPMHLAVYRATGAAAIVHTHSPFVVALSTVLDELPAVHYAMAGLGGPVRVAPYARFGSAELARNAVAGLAGRAAVILANHGALACGASLGQAFDRARTLEWLARVYWYARQAGDPRTLTAAQLDEVRDTIAGIGYGEPGPEGPAGPPA
jgi:L-fuculose-phosphate aldolase